jgi:hypothetical protein
MAHGIEFVTAEHKFGTGSHQDEAPRCITIGWFEVVGGSNASGGLRRIDQSHHELSADACPLQWPHGFRSHDPSTLTNCLGFNWFVARGGRLEFSFVIVSTRSYSIVKLFS